MAMNILYWAGNGGNVSPVAQTEAKDRLKNALPRASVQLLSFPVA